MNRHYVGKVVVFNPEPSPADLNVDVPVLSQGEQVAEEIIIQLPDNELTDDSRDRLDVYTRQDLVSLDTLRANTGVAPAKQMDVARALAEQPARWRSAVAWNGAYPTTGQVKDLAGLLFTLTGGGERRPDGRRPLITACSNRPRTAAIRRFIVAGAAPRRADSRTTRRPAVAGCCCQSR